MSVCDPCTNYKFTVIGDRMGNGWGEKRIPFNTRDVIHDTLTNISDGYIDLHIDKPTWNMTILEHSTREHESREFNPVGFDGDAHRKEANYVDEDSEAGREANIAEVNFKDERHGG